MQDTTRPFGNDQDAAAERRKEFLASDPPETYPPGEFSPDEIAEHRARCADPEFQAQVAEWRAWFRETHPPRVVRRPTRSAP